MASRWESVMPLNTKYTSCRSGFAMLDSSSFATISSAQEKSSAPTCEKSMIVSAFGPSWPICSSISVRTAAPVGRVTRFEYSAQTLRFRTELRSMWFTTLRHPLWDRYLELGARKRRESFLAGRLVRVPVGDARDDARGAAAHGELPIPMSDELAHPGETLAATLVRKAAHAVEHGILERDRVVPA